MAGNLVVWRQAFLRIIDAILFKWLTKIELTEVEFNSIQLNLIQFTFEEEDFLKKSN